MNVKNALQFQHLSKAGDYPPPTQAYLVDFPTQGDFTCVQLRAL